MTKTWLHSSLFKAIATLLVMWQAGFAGAAVTMVGTRVIYDPRSQGATLRFDNPDGGPNVMQLWVDTGNEHSTPETADAPFVVTPPIFRIEPGGGQTVRLLFTGKDMPQDRESVFFLNTLQIPSLNPAHSNQNQILFMVRNRLKIFYRPPGIEGSPQRAIERLSLRVGGEGPHKQVIADNASGYYISVATGSLACGSHAATLGSVMIAPRSESALNVQGVCPLDAASIRATLRYIDDQGGLRDAQFPVATQGTR